MYVAYVHPQVPSSICGHTSCAGLAGWFRLLGACVKMPMGCRRRADRKLVPGAQTTRESLRSCWRLGGQGVEGGKRPGLLKSNITTRERLKEVSASVCPPSGQRLPHCSPLYLIVNTVSTGPASFPHWSRGWQLAGEGGRG